MVPGGFRGMRPRAIGVRVVAFPGHHVFVHEVQILKAKLILNEAGHKVLEEDIARHLPAEICVGPGMVMAMREISTLQQIGHPTNAAL